MNIPYFNENDNFILYNGDTNSVLSEMNMQVDMIFADPPYFLSNQNDSIWQRKNKR